MLNVMLGKNKYFAVADEPSAREIPCVFLSSGTLDMLLNRFADRDLPQKPFRVEDSLAIQRRHAV